MSKANNPSSFLHLQLAKSERNKRVEGLSHGARYPNWEVREGPNEGTEIHSQTLVLCQARPCGVFMVCMRPLVLGSLDRIQLLTRETTWEGNLGTYLVDLVGRVLPYVSTLSILVLE